MAIIHRYIAKQVGLVFVVTYLVLALVLLAQLLSKLLSRVIEGDLTLDALWIVLTLGLTKSTALLAPFSILMSVLLVIARLQSNSEWSAMRASGFSDRQLITAVAYIVLPVTLMVTVAVSHAIPWANRFAEVIEEISEQTMGLQNIAPGQFLEIPDQQAVIYAQSREGDGKKLKNVFVYRGTDQGEDIEVARNLSIQSGLAGENAFVFSNGSHYQLGQQNKEFSVSHYQLHEVILPSASFANKADRSEYQPIGVLWSSDRLDYRAEFWQRVSIVVSVLVLAWFAVAIGAGNGKLGRNVKIIIGLILYFIYFNVIVVTTKQMEDGAFWASVIQLAMPVMIAAAGLWFYRRNNLVGG